jgi:HAD superfamily phosphatase
MKPLLVFDMDGVLVDVTESYREAIAQTTAHFTGAAISNERIQEYKNAGGFNDDWELTHRIVRDAGVEASFEEVKRRFQRLFLGEGPVGRTPRSAAGPLAGLQPRSAPPPDALIMREKWIARPGALERLSKLFRLAVFTGRPREEAAITLDRFARGLTFEPVIGMEDVKNHKPHPEGLLRAVWGQPFGTAAALSGGEAPAQPHSAATKGGGGPEGLAPQAWYIGDSIDDARCARAAGVPFIGIAAASNPRRAELAALFEAEGARAVVDDINCLEEALAR